MNNQDTEDYDPNETYTLAVCDADKCINEAIVKSPDSSSGSFTYYCRKHSILRKAKLIGTIILLVGMVVLLILLTASFVNLLTGNIEITVAS